MVIEITRPSWYALIILRTFNSNESFFLAIVIHVPNYTCLMLWRGFCITYHVCSILNDEITRWDRMHVVCFQVGRGLLNIPLSVLLTIFQTWHHSGYLSNMNTIQTIIYIYICIYIILRTLARNVAKPWYYRFQYFPTCHMRNKFKNFFQQRSRYNCLHTCRTDTSPEVDKPNLKNISNMLFRCRHCQQVDVYCWLDSRLTTVRPDTLEKYLIVWRPASITLDNIIIWRFVDMEISIWRKNIIAIVFTTAALICLWSNVWRALLLTKMIKKGMERVMKSTNMINRHALYLFQVVSKWHSLLQFGPNGGYCPHWL